MPDEQAGLGPAALETPEAESGAPLTPESPEATAESAPVAPELPPIKPEQGGKYEKLLSSVQQAASIATPTDDDTKTDVATLQTLQDEQAKVDHLVKLAQTKGLPHAVRVAERLKDYYALDVFHDTLVDNLYDALLQQGLITKE